MAAPKTKPTEASAERHRCDRERGLAKPGRHKPGKVCVYIRRLADVDLKVLEELIAGSVAETRSRYPQPDATTPDSAGTRRRRVGEAHVRPLRILNDAHSSPRAG